VNTQVTWSGGANPPGEDSLYRFFAQPAGSGTSTSQVEQTYSDGSIVNWNGSEPSAAPAIEVRSSLGGGSASALTIAALVLAAVALIGRGVALLSRGGTRPLA
jgi:hypothetical protein